MVLKTPIYIAPNLLTIVGLLINIITSVILIWFSPDAKAEAPRWCYMACAVGLFIYQSLDAIGEFLLGCIVLNKLKRFAMLDGKQARRTNTSSPLGELFDHG